jgi:hypothetical protein
MSQDEVVILFEGYVSKWGGLEVFQATIRCAKTSISLVGDSACFARI